MPLRAAAVLLLFSQIRSSNADASVSTEYSWDDIKAITDRVLSLVQEKWTSFNKDEVTSRIFFDGFLNLPASALIAGLLLLFGLLFLPLLGGLLFLPLISGLLLGQAVLPLFGQLNIPPINFGPNVGLVPPPPLPPSGVPGPPGPKGPPGPIVIPCRAKHKGYGHEERGYKDDVECVYAFVKFHKGKGSHKAKGNHKRKQKGSIKHPHRDHGYYGDDDEHEPFKAWATETPRLHWDDKHVKFIALPPDVDRFKAWATKGIDARSGTTVPTETPGDTQ